jgi:hypothetical protein
MNWKQSQPTWVEDAAPNGNVIPFRRISTEEMAQDLTFDLRVIADRIGEYERDMAALKRLQSTKADQLDICLRVIGRLKT